MNCNKCKHLIFQDGKPVCKKAGIPYFTNNCILFEYDENVDDYRYAKAKMEKKITNKEKPLIAKSFKIEPIIQEDLGNYIYKYVEKYISESIDNWENFCIDSLYKEYQKHGFTKAFVINREEFKQFLLWALPEYYKRFKKETI